MKGSPLVLVHPFYSSFIDDESKERSLAEEPYKLFDNFHGEGLFRKRSAIYLEGLNRSYLGNLDHLVGLWEGPMIVLEEDSNLLETKERLENKCKESYFVITPSNDPTPLEVFGGESFGKKVGLLDSRSPGAKAYWDKFTSFLRGFGKKEVALAGGELFSFESDKGNMVYMGCLGNTYYNLRNRGFDPRFVKGSCFK